MQTPFELRVGEKLKLRSIFLGYYYLVYTGMPNDRTYSFALTYEQGYSGYAYNLYFPKGQTQITVQKMQMDILSVTPDGIQLRFVER